MKKRKVIIDCDPGIDDSLAIMLALQSEELEIVGITIVCGNCPVEMGFGNAKKVLKHMGRLDVPVYIGVEKPLRREYVNALDTHFTRSRRIPSGDGSSGIPCIKAERRTHFRNSTWTDDESCNIARTRQSCV